MDNPAAYKKEGIDRACPLHDNSWRNVSRTPTTNGDKRHLIGTCCSCHNRTVGVIRRDHVPRKLIWIERRSDLKSDGDTPLVPNYPR